MFPQRDALADEGPGVVHLCLEQRRSLSVVVGVSRLQDVHETAVQAGDGERRVRHTVGTSAQGSSPSRERNVLLLAVDVVRLQHVRAEERRVRAVQVQRQVAIVDRLLELLTVGRHIQQRHGVTTGASQFFHRHLDRRIRMATVDQHVDGVLFFVGEDGPGVRHVERRRRGTGVATSHYALCNGVDHDLVWCCQCGHVGLDLDVAGEWVDALFQLRRHAVVIGCILQRAGELLHRERGALVQVKHVDDEVQHRGRQVRRVRDRLAQRIRRHTTGVGERHRRLVGLTDLRDEAEACTVHTAVDHVTDSLRILRPAQRHCVRDRGGGRDHDGRHW
ncbi:hypothetical protein D3C87_1354010 [compost metagenome]